jgi:hypothetical protein
MKRLIASIAVLLIISTYLLSCEKDDLCADGTPTTPGLVVEFYKKSDRDSLNAVPNFKYWVPGINDTIPSKDEAAKSVSRIVLPLRTDQDEVTWALQYNTVTPSGTKLSNVDLLTIKYTRQNTYVSRACGYKTTFTLNPATSGNPNPSVTDADTKLFIDGNPEVVTPYIENENEAHVKIYF